LFDSIQKNGYFFAILFPAYYTDNKMREKIFFFCSSMIISTILLNIDQFLSNNPIHTGLYTTPFAAKERNRNSKQKI